MAQLVAWSMDCKLYRDQKLERIRLVYLLSLAGLSLGFALMSRYQNWETWTQHFLWTAFYSFFLFSAYLMQDSLTE